VEEGGVNCSCDCEQPSAYWKEIRCARKAHTCHECGGPIAPGKSYEHVFAIWDGDADTVKTCEACLALRDWVSELGGCQPCHGELVEEAVEELRNMTGPRTSDVRRSWWRGARLCAQAMRRQDSARDARRQAKRKVA
jgi:hypothetical protein